MQQKSANFKVKGMQRDLSVSAFSSEFAYENKNIRIMATDENTLLSLINEKGNKKATIEGIESIEGTPIGQAVLNEDLVIFTCKKSEGDLDRIYKFSVNNEEITGKLLFEGNLNFETTCPIETISVYENEDIKKVYWTDGKNPPRLINIGADESTIQSWNSNSFDFTRALNLRETINIERNVLAGGTFAPGVIQYAFTYFNKYGQESNIFYQSPLFYISYNNRGASPEDKVSNSFNITIENFDKTFDYIRVYSIHRTSINATPDCKSVVDLAARGREETTLTYTDDGEAGDSIDPTELLYVGGEDVIFGTMTQKDNTLFLGNIILKRKIIDSTIREYFKEGNVSFEVVNLDYYDDGNSKSLVFPDPKGYYPYDNQLKLNSFQFKTFKYLDWYRFGIQFQHYTGKWSEPIWINDVRNTQHVTTTFYDNSNVLLPIAKFNLNNADIIKRLVSQGYIKARPVIVYPSINDREVICQGVLCPTVYNVEDRFTNSPFAQSSWFTRPNAPFDIERTKGVYVCVLTLSSPVASENFEAASKYTDGTNTWDYYSANTYRLDDTDNTVMISAIVLSYNSYTDDKAWPADPVNTLNPVGEGSSFTYKEKAISRASSWNSFNIYDGVSEYSKAGVMSNESTTVSVSGQEQGPFKLADKGAWAEFRHNYPIPDNSNKNAEIQCIVNPPSVPTVNNDASNSDITDWVSNNSEDFYVDQSIVTLHSPDIEFDTDVRSIDLSNVKLRIVGVAPLTAFASDIDIQTSTPVNNFYDSTEMPIGFYKQKMSAEHGFGNKGDSHFGFRGMISAPFWFDELTAYKKDTGNTHHYTTGFVVYPWHRNGSLNNTKFSEDGYRSAMLDEKKMSNLRFSYKTQYLNQNNIWNAYVEDDANKTGIAGVSVFDSDEVTLVRLPSPQNSNIGEINYYGNVDKVVVMSRVGDKEDGYPIMTSGLQNAAENASTLFNSNYMGMDDRFTDQTTGTDPVRIKYKSTPHAVLNLNYSKSGAQRILPTNVDGTWGISTSTSWTVNPQEASSTTTKAFWDKNSSSYIVSQDVITPGFSGDLELGLGLDYGFLWVGELYNDTVINRFGGQTEEAFENNLWLPCGNSISLVDEKDEALENVDIKWIEGDTYYQRYDHIKTYPFTLQDQNSVTDIISFMCETRVNIDGRYDRNRGQTSNLAVTTENFNQMNQVYSQENSFFNYRTINPNKVNLDNFHNSITWTKTKTLGDLVDTWTNITLASALDLDGDKGEVRALRRFNNQIIAFQDKGISQIMYNENMQLSTTEGVPVEIANSGKVTGKRYFAENIGCTNKWSICETPSGLFFMDNLTKSLYLFNGKLDNISDNNGFHSWFNNEITNDIWNPVEFNNFISYFDNNTGDVFFINKDNTIAFNTAIGRFTSFYSYEGTPYFSDINGLGLSLHKDLSTPDNDTYYLWLQNKGEYNYFYNKYQPFYTTVIANPNMQTDKVFSNIEFRSDSWDSQGNLLNSTFDTLTTWNEYQEGKINLVNTKDRPSSLKKKFRIWRANIPRDTTHRRDRMRNPWLYVKLSKENENTDKTILHDLAVQYFN